jgi:8-oxo-dGTP pyrophosphatase MutT (NUDIX family)
MIQRLDLAQKAFIMANGKLLLVKKSADDPERPGLWEVPGGRMKLDEEVDDHIRREVLEEVGLAVAPGEPFHVWQWVMNSRDGNGQVKVVAIARVCHTQDTALDYAAREDDDYLDVAEWVPLGEIHKYNLIPSLQPAMDKFVASNAT